MGFLSITGDLEKDNITSSNKIFSIVLVTALVTVGLAGLFFATTAPEYLHTGTIPAPDEHTHTRIHVDDRASEMEVIPVNNRDYLPTVIEMIRDATTRIHIIQYLISNQGSVKDILDELITAYDRGVEVMVLCDETVNYTHEGVEYLLDHGINAKFDSGRKTTHNKLIIADNRTLLGSTNFSNTSINEANEANVLINDPQIADYYEEYFQSLWKDASVEPVLSKAHTDKIVPIINREIFQYLNTSINNAQSDVRVLIYIMAYKPEYPDSKNNQLLENLIAAHHRGVNVAVILDNSYFTSTNHINDEAVTMLEAEGITFRYAQASKITHAKVVICDDSVIIGDSNWAYSALEKYNGVSVKVTDAGIADAYRSYFDHVWDQSGEGGDQDPDVDPPEQGSDRTEGSESTVIIAISAVVGTVIIVAIAYLILRWRRNR